jgi:antagonist of KipI
MTDAIEVLWPGARTSVQDLGRFGYQHLGFGVSGATDQRSLVLANQLVGNDIGAAAIEATVQGPRLRFPIQCQVAIVGCDPVAKVNGETVRVNQTILVMAGDILDILRTGAARAYVAVAGGILVTPVLGSRSTDLVGGIGGVEGRSLQTGDLLPVVQSPPLRPRSIQSQWIPRRRLSIIARAVVGPQADMFRSDSMASLFSAQFVVQPASDSMGLRLDGPALHPPSQILSEGQPAGSVEIPPSGLPIVLLAGRQTVGGYAKVAVVSRVDLPDLGQLMPGDSIGFQLVGLDQAVEVGQRWMDALIDPSQTVVAL